MNELLRWQNVKTAKISEMVQTKERTLGKNTVTSVSQKIVSKQVYQNIVKIGLSSSKKKCFICFNESLLKVMKNAFYFILKALFVLKIFNFLS